MNQGKHKSNECYKKIKQISNTKVSKNNKYQNTNTNIKVSKNNKYQI